MTVTSDTQRATRRPRHSTADARQSAPVATEWRLLVFGCRLSWGRARVLMRRMRTDATKCAPSASRVETAVEGLEGAVIDVGVDLRGGDTGVPQHLLDGADLRTVRQQVAGETMPEDVRGDGF